MRAAPAPAALEGGAEEVERCGTLVALRRVSARLFFGDLESDEGACSLVFKRERWCGCAVGFCVWGRPARRLTAL